MPNTPLKDPSEMSPETLRNCRACYEVQDLYWERKETTDPKECAEIDRKLVDFLLKLSESGNLFEQVGLSELEVHRLKKNREVTNQVRIKLRIWAESVTYSIVGT